MYRSSVFILTIAMFFCPMFQSGGLESAHALNISETIDFLDTENRLPLDSLDLGVNTVSGNLSFGDFKDVVPLEVLSGFEITGINVTITNLMGGPSFAHVVTPSGPGGSVTNILKSSNGVFSHPTSDFPLGAGVYDFSTTLNGLSNENWNADWEIAITVGRSNPIPEPSTMLLLGTGLAGLAAWRYRK